MSGYGATFSTKQMLHPSITLQNNDVKGFEDAMRVYAKQMRYENKLTEQLAAEQNQPLTDLDRKSMADLEDYAKKAEIAAGIYANITAAARMQAVAVLRTSGDEIMSDFADALESGDYSHLAI